jgi:lysophospholipase L1-like esterase
MKIPIALLALSAGLIAHGASTETAAFSDRKPYTMATESIPNGGGWMTRSDALAKNAAKGAEIAFIGDSITQGWEAAGKAAWEKDFVSHWKCVNLGISGDRTENVLWRLNHGGNLGGGALKPKAFVILIGTNNAGHRKDSPEAILAGVKEILDTLHRASPGSKVILTAIFPRTSDPKAGEIVLAANPLLKALAKERGATWFDINEKLAPGGKVTKEVFPDGLHLNAPGYAIWATALKPVLAEAVK